MQSKIWLKMQQAESCITLIHKKFVLFCIEKLIKSMFMSFLLSLESSKEVQANELSTFCLSLLFYSPFVRSF
jgi:hypothetical protein